MNVAQIITIVKLYLKHAPHQPDWSRGKGICVQKTQNCKSIAVAQAERYLQPILAACPSLAEAYFLMAKIKLLSSDLDGALCMVDKCLQRNGSFSEALLLKARICVYEGKPQTANQSLEMALSHDFQIRDKLEYVLVKANSLMLERKFEEAIHFLQERESVYSNNSSNNRRKFQLNDEDKVTIGLLMMELLIASNKQVMNNLCPTEKP